MGAQARYDEICDDIVARNTGTQLVPAAHAAEWPGLAEQALSFRATT
jgi:hypothetical protein